jgi:hypothetical protein
VTQATLEERLKAQREAKDGEIKVLRGEVGTLKPKADAHDTLAGERDTLQAQLARLTSGTERRDVLAGIGVTDAKVVDTFGLLYDSHVAGIDAATRPAFRAWVEDPAEAGARGNPVLAPYFAAPTVVAPKAPASFPAPSTGVKPGSAPGPAQKMTPQQMRDFLRGKTPAEVEAWQREHGAEYGWLSSPPKAPAPAPRSPAA